MPTSGHVHHADLGEPLGDEAGFPRPVILMASQLVLAPGPRIVHVVPVTGTRRGSRSEVDVDPDGETPSTRSPSSVPDRVSCTFDGTSGQGHPRRRRQEPAIIAGRREGV